MARKIFSAILIFSVVLTASVAMAARNPRSDRSLLLFYEYQGYEYFLERSSFDWYEDDGLQIVSFEYFVYDDRHPDSTNYSYEVMSFAYDAAERKVYFVNASGDLDYLDPYGRGSGYAEGAEKIYYLAFGERFYGTYEDEFYYSFWD